jgi:hypothetical protein
MKDLILNSGRAQLVGDVADELGFRLVEGHLAGNILDGDGDPFNVFFGLIEHCVEQNAQGATVRIGQGYPKFHGFGFALHRLKQRAESAAIAPAKESAPGCWRHPRHVLIPPEDTAGGGIHQHRVHIGIEQNRAVGNGGNQGFEFGFFGGEFFNVLLFVAL